MYFENRFVDIHSKIVILCSGSFDQTYSILHGTLDK